MGNWMLMLYLTWSPWHYSGQNYGIALMFLGRRGVSVAPGVKRWFYASFVCSFALAFLGIHTAGSADSYAPGSFGPDDYTMVRLGIPPLVAARGIVLAAAGSVVSLAVVASALRREASWRELAPAAALVALQLLWFSLPVLSRATGWPRRARPVQRRLGGRGVRQFSKELTTSVMFLNERELDIRCVRLKPYNHDGRTLVDVQQVLPLPEASDYTVKLREKAREERRKRRTGRDLTKFDVTIGEKVETRLPKRQAMFRVVKHVCESGVSPEEVSKVLPRSHARLWRHASGKLDTEAFIETVSAAADAGGPKFEPARWWVEPGELIVSGGSTYAFTKMWGEDTEKGMGNLLKAFPQTDIAVRRSSMDGEL